MAVDGYTFGPGTAAEMVSSLRLLCGRLVCSGYVPTRGDQLERLGAWFGIAGKRVKAFDEIYWLIGKVFLTREPRESALALLGLNELAQRLGNMLARTAGEIP